MGQKGVLLCLVEAMNLIDKQDGLAGTTRLMILSTLNGRANLLHAIEHRRQRFEVIVTGGGDDLRQSGLAYTRRAPKNHRVRQLVLNRLIDRFSRAEQMILPNKLFQI